MKKLLVAALTLLSMGCFFGSSKTLKTDSPVASVDGRIITVATLDSTVLHLQKNLSPEFPTDSLKAVALDSLINHKLIEIRLDSIKNVLNNDWEFRQGRLENINQTVMQVLFEKQIAPRVHADSAMVAKQYNDNIAKYNDPEQVKARHILVRFPKPETTGVKSESRKKELVQESEKFALERANGVLKKALDGENWDTLAATYSEDKNNSTKGGDLGFFYRGRMAAEFDSAAFGAKPGDIVGPIKTRFGYHIIKVDEYKAASPRPLDEELWGQIYADLVNDQQGKLSTVYLDSLKAAGVMQYNEPVIAMPDSLLKDQDWVMIANSTDTVFGKTMKDNLPRYKRWKNIDTIAVADKKDMLGILAPTYLLRSAARAQGYMSDPKIVKASEEVTNIEASLRLSRFLRNLDYEPTEEEIGAYFNSHISDYKETRPLLVYHILFQDSTMAETIRDSITAGADFAEMAKRYYPGDPEIREVLYNLDYIGPDEMGADFYKAASSLAVGEVSHATKTNWGYHLIKLVNKKQDRTLAQVRPGIKQRLKDSRDAAKTAGYMSEWRKMALIQKYQKAYDSYQPSTGKKVIHIETATAPKNTK